MSARGELVALWRGRLADELARALPAPSPAPTRGSVPSVSRDLEVSSHLSAAGCPAGALADEGFTESARTAARAIALETLRTLEDPTARGAPVPAIRRIRESMAEPTLFRAGLADFLAGLDRAGRAAVEASATAWMLDAQALASRRGEPEWLEPANLAHRVGAPTGQRVRLTAAVDARRRQGAELRLFAMRVRAGESDQRLARRLALMWSLVKGEMVSSVVLGYRESLELGAHPIDGADLEVATAELVSEIGWVLRPSTAPVRVGPACSWCVRLEQCEDGRSHLSGTVQLPFPPNRRSTTSLERSPAIAQPTAGGDPTM